MLAPKSRRLAVVASPAILIWVKPWSQEFALYPIDRTFEYQRAFEKAETAWIRWRRSPLGEAPYEAQGVALLQAFMDAAATYLEHARQQTGVRFHDPARYAKDVNLADLGPAWDADLEIPSFLRRQANT